VADEISASARQGSQSGAKGDVLAVKVMLKLLFWRMDGFNWAPKVQFRRRFVVIYVVYIENLK